MPKHTHDTRNVPDEAREAEFRQKVEEKDNREYLSQERFPAPEEYRSRLLELGREAHAEAFDKVLELVGVFEKAGGQALLVGGVVRDSLFGKVAKDFDLEVYGLEPQVIKELVQAHGKVKEVGEAFGILTIQISEGVAIDVSLPRRDSKTGTGHKDFSVDADPHMTVAEAARRRDFTFNALAAHPINGDIFDPFGGVEDAKNRVLRVTDAELFADDPLRVLRGVQFIGRFGLEVEPESLGILKKMVPELRHISPERFKDEWKKLFLRSEKPSIGLSTAMTIGVMHEMHPQFVEMPDTRDLMDFGPVDTWIHTLATVDQAAVIARLEGLSEKSSTTLMLAAFAGNLVHGDVAGGRASESSEKVDVSPVKAFLEQINMDNKTRDAVLALVASRHVPGQMFVQDQIREQAITDGQIRRLAEQVHPTTIEELVLLAEADHMGRGAFVPSSPEELMMPRDGFPARGWLLERARALGIHDKKPGNVIEGRDLIAFGYRPGKEFGELIKLAKDLRDEKGYTRDRIFVELDGITIQTEAITHLKLLLDR